MSKSNFGADKMSKSIYRNDDTDAIDAQIGHDNRSNARRTFDGVAEAGYTLVRGVGKTVAMTFAIAVGGTIALVAGTKLTSEIPTDEQPVDIEIFMKQYGIQGTPEEFIDKLLKDGTINPDLIPYEAPSEDNSVDPGMYIQPQKKPNLMVMGEVPQTPEV